MQMHKEAWLIQLRVVGPVANEKTDQILTKGDGGCLALGSMGPELLVSFSLSKEARGPDFYVKFSHF